MKNVILFSLGLVLVNLIACTTKTIEEKTPVKIPKNIAKKKDVPTVNQPKVIQEYKKTVSKNIQKNQNLKKSRLEFETTKESLLKEMELIRTEFAKTQDREKYLKRKNEIVKKLNAAQKKYDRSMEVNEVVNYTEANSIK